MVKITNSEGDFRAQQKGDDIGGMLGCRRSRKKNGRAKLGRSGRIPAFKCKKFNFQVNTIWEREPLGRKKRKGGAVQSYL